jgi:hypothetical protein
MRSGLSAPWERRPPQNGSWEPPGFGARLPRSKENESKLLANRVMVSADTPETPRPPKSPAARHVKDAQIDARPCTRVRAIPKVLGRFSSSRRRDDRRCADISARC